MELKLEDRRIMTLQIEADLTTGYDEITHFISAMDKINKKASRPGFQRDFNAKERIVLNGLWDNIKKYAADKA